jgi:hypothetical protein
MNGQASGDLCLHCGNQQMPFWDPRGPETARACQGCGYIEQRPPRAPELPPGKPAASSPLVEMLLRESRKALHSYYKIGPGAAPPAAAGLGPKQ